jgi:hypothetical protein
MSPAANNPNDLGAASQPKDRATSNQPVETIYTTVESQQDRTDWLTVVSNLRQINRQLVEEIARLEQSLASTKQSLHTKKEENQAHEITILQQQDELRITHDRVGALFQQLETSHQIGQRQQTLIETLSQQLEITKTIVPQIEAEHEELCQKYQQQSQKLTKTEQVAIELHRRLKLQTNSIGKETAAITTNIIPASATTPAIEITSATETFAPETSRETSILTVFTSTPEILFQRDIDPPTPDLSPLETAIFDSDISSTEIDPSPPPSPLQMSDIATPKWTPSALTPSSKTILPPPKLSKTISWREAIRQDRDNANASNNYDDCHLETSQISTHLSPETIHKESIPIADPIAKSTPNWPAPTVNRDSVQHGTSERKIDLPKFPRNKKVEN